MREYLFHGKRVDNGEWVEGYYVYDESEQVAEKLTAYIYHLNAHPCGPSLIPFEVVPESVGQYTGLTDKNNKKIFEGDIIDASGTWWDACGPAGHDSPIIEVKWSDEHCGFDPFANYDCDCGVYIEAYGVEVIGNIHDNPELLEGGAE